MIASNWRNRTSITIRFIPRKLRKWILDWQRKKPRPMQRPRLRQRLLQPKRRRLPRRPSSLLPSPLALRLRLPRRLKEKADQIFVLLAHWLVSFLPAFLQHPAMVLLGVVAIIATFPALFAITVLLERKGLGRMQNRYGPNRVGPYGIFQPVADGIKSLTKEDIVPFSADAVVHFLAPVLLVVVVFMGYAVLPIGRNMTLVNMDAGLLFFFAIGASSELSVFMAGWSSRNKYSLLGSMRRTSTAMGCRIGTSSRRGDSRASCCLRLPRRRRPIARHSICRRASRNWSPATSPNIRASNLRCFF